MNEPKGFQYKRGGYLTVVFALQSLGAAIQNDPAGAQCEIFVKIYTADPPATAVLNQQDLVRKHTNTCLIGILTSAAK